MRNYYCLILVPLLTLDLDHSIQPLLKSSLFMGNTVRINYDSTPVTSFLGYIKSEESSGVNTEVGLSDPELTC